MSLREDSYIQFTVTFVVTHGIFGIKSIKWFEVPIIDLIFLYFQVGKLYIYIYIYSLHHKIKVNKRNSALARTLKESSRQKVRGAAESPQVGPRS